MLFASVFLWKQWKERKECRRLKVVPLEYPALAENHLMEGRSYCSEIGRLIFIYNFLITTRELKTCGTAWL